VSTGYAALRFGNEVGELARTLFPGGRLIEYSDDSRAALRDSADAFAREPQGALRARVRGRPEGTQSPSGGGDRRCAENHPLSRALRALPSPACNPRNEVEVGVPTQDG
jgi:hypothetical protein